MLNVNLETIERTMTKFMELPEGQQQFVLGYMVAVQQMQELAEKRDPPKKTA